MDRLLSLKKSRFPRRISAVRVLGRLLACLLAVGWGLPVSAELVLVRDGRIACALIVSEPLLEATGPHALRDEAWGNPHDAERAIAEIEEHLGLLGQGELTVQRLPAAEIPAGIAGHANAGRSVIVLGGAELDAGLDRQLRESSDDPEAFALRVEASVATVLGPTPKGVLNGVYELLEQLGFRWYMPGEFGRVIPDGATHGLREQAAVHAPSFVQRSRLNISRNLFGRHPNWPYRMRHSDILPSWGGGHGTPPYRTGQARRNAFEEHPEHFALINRERQPRQLCVSNPEVLDLVVTYHRERFRENPDDRTLRVSPNDGGSYCECEDCRALDSGALASFQTRIPSMTDRYIWFKNQAIDRLIDEFPDIRVPVLIYAAIMDPPMRFTPDPRAEWTGSIAAIHICRIHGSGNPHCPESSYPLWLVKKWTEAGVNTRIGGYSYNLACPGFPFMMIHRFRREVPLFYQHGARAGGPPWHTSTWATHGPSHYLNAKLLWDVDTDADALLADFFANFYGPAADAMERYTMRLDRALFESDYHTGSSWDFPHIYDDAVRADARSALRAAERRVGLRGGLLGRRLVPATEVDEKNRRYAERVEVAVKGWQYFEEFADMMERRRRFDFDGAMEALERAVVLRDSLLEDYEYPMLDPRNFVVGFLDAFFGNTTRDGYERMKNGGELIAGLDSTWEFMIEPQGVGERIGLHDPFHIGGNWGTIDTHHSWGTQGLRYYFGEAWYRQRVHIPEDAAGKRVKLWFSGVDRGARVWLNGHLLGTSPGTVFDIDAHGGITRPFAFDVSGVLRPGEENVVVARTIRDISNELGTGGLRDVAMFYVPGAEQAEE